ncbi:beta-galactosidase GalA [Bacteroidota bacterium]
MRNKIVLAAILAFCLLVMSCTRKDVDLSKKFDISNTPRERISMDFDWRFHLGHTSDIERDFMFGKARIFVKTGSSNRGGRALSATHKDFDDNAWRKVDLPHDWAVELDFHPEADRSHGFKMVGRQWPSNSIGWYRKTFEIPENDEGNRLSVEFDGVFRDCLVFLNGHFIGRNMGGYNSFRYDISDYANYGGKNVLVVRVDASLFEGWFYEGAGIYRHVWLVKSDPLHVSHWGTFVSSTVTEENGSVSAELSINTKISNEDEEQSLCSLISTILNAEGNIIAETKSKEVLINAWDNNEFTQKIRLSNPELWSIDSPNLYRLVSTVLHEGVPVDTYETPFGIRSVRFDADSGFYLNGKSLKIKGVCIHHDHAGVGSALPDGIQDFRIRKLKEMGCNAYRCAHNPPTPELLDACDRLGMLVLDEQRMSGSSTEILSQLESVVLRDRNHPCVFLWSMGNEEMNIQATDEGTRILTTMKRVIKDLDPTRLVTIADNNVNDSWGSEFSLVSDVLGCNYWRIGDADAFHTNFPDQPIIGTENASTQCTRGIYTNDEEKGFTNAYGTTLPSWGSIPEDAWKFCADRPYIGGVFLWTGIDYRGEPSPYGWPCINSHYGIMDVCCFPKDSYYYYKSWWGDETVLHIFPHWNWAGKEGQEIDVWCYSNCDEVELFLNEESLGKKKMPLNSHLEWKVAYKPGQLEAKGYRNGDLIAEKKIETAGAPAQLELLPDRMEIWADNQDVAVITVAINDSEGLFCPTSQNEVSFSISENAKIIGVGNGNPSSHEADKATKRKVFNGLCQVIVQSTRDVGEIQLIAKSPGLQEASIIISAEPCEQKPYIPSIEN